MPKPVRGLRDLFRDGGPYEGRHMMTVPELLRGNGQDAFGTFDANHWHAATALKAEGFTNPEHLRVRIDGDVRQLWVRDPSGLLIKLSADQVRERYISERSGSNKKAA